MCDGSCNRCFHENCVDPPVRLADIPEDEGWLCPACDCKVCGVWGACEALPLQHITCLPQHGLFLKTICFCIARLRWLD